MRVTLHSNGAALAQALPCRTLTRGVEWSESDGKGAGQGWASGSSEPKASVPLPRNCPPRQPQSRPLQQRLECPEPNKGFKWGQDHRLMDLGKYSGVLGDLSFPPNSALGTGSDKPRNQDLPREW